MSYQQIEKAIIDWYLHEYKEIADNLKVQFSSATIIEREFTSGGGVFLIFSLPAGIVPTGYPSESIQLEGPLINSSELEHGASVGLGFKGDGFIDYLEIWCHGGDYPHDRHPLNFDLSSQKINYIDLR